MLTIGSINARIGLDSSGYSRGMLEAQAANSAFGANFAQFVGNPLLGGIGMLRQAGGWFVETSKRVLENAEATERMSQRTGVATTTLQALRAEMDLAHSAGGKVTEMMNAFAIRVGQARENAGPAASAFAAMGIDLASVANNEQLLRLVIERLDQIPDAAQRGATAARIFGEQAGPLLVNAINGGEQALDRLIRRQSDLGQVLEASTITRLATLNTTIGTVRQGVDGLAQSVIAAFLEGFADQTGQTDKNIVRLARTIKDELVPAARDLSEVIRSIVGSTREWTSSNGETIEGIRVVIDAARYLQDILVPISANLSSFGMLTQGLTRFSDERSLSRQRSEAASVRALRASERASGVR